MVIVSFVILALLINAIACALAFRYVQREFRLTLNAHARKIRRHNKAAKLAIAKSDKRWQEEAADLRDAFNQLRAIVPEKDKGLNLGHTFRDKMEERYVRAEAEAKKVTVQGIPGNN